MVSKKLKRVSVLIVAALIAAVLMISSPVSVSVSDGGIVSAALATGDGDSSVGEPAYQVMIPNGAGSETGLQVFPPKLQSDGREDNWLSVSHPYKDVTVGEYTYDDEGDCIAVDSSKGDIYVRETDNVLVITAGALSDSCKYDIEVVDYTLYGGETIWNEEGQKNTVEELRARFRDYVYGSGSDLYQLEDVPQKDGLAHIDSIQKVSVYAYVKAQDGATEATASTKIMLGGESYNGTDIVLNSSEQRIVTEYSINPYTKKPWLWADINDLQAGITLEDAECSFVNVEVEFLVHSQTFFPITPVEVTPGTASAWTDVDVSSYAPDGATGVILHIVNTSGTNYALGIRKNGSSDDRYRSLFLNSHLWAATGVDADRIFEAYVQSTSYIDIYLVGYTMSGVTFFTNAYDKSLATINEWTDIDCSAEAPDAIGLIFEGYSGAGKYVGFRKNGSSDDRTGYSYYRLWTMIGCDASQVCEGYTSYTNYDFFLIGYITDGCTFNTNATDVSLGSTGSWQDLPALPADSIMGFIEVNASVGADYGLRKNGSSEEIYLMAAYHPWAFVECDASYIIEGKIADTGIDFFVVGYATAEGGEEVTADFSGDPLQGIKGSSLHPPDVDFTDETTGGTPPYAYDWDFGDGSTHGTTANPSHTYAPSGTLNGQQYTVSLMVTDDALNEDTETKVDYVTIYQKGDINTNLTVNSLDITEIELVVGEVSGHDETFTSDTNDDGNINSIDITQTEILVGSAA